MTGIWGSPECSLQTDWPLPDGAAGHSQPQSKSPSAHTEPKPMNVARGWAPWLMLGAAWMFPPCVWIRAGPHPPSSAHCENTFLSVNKRCSKTGSRLCKGWGFRPLSKLTLHWESAKFHFLKLLGCFKRYLSKAMPVPADCEVKHPVVCSRGWEAFLLCSARFAVLLSLPLALTNADGSEVLWDP